MNLKTAIYEQLTNDPAITAIVGDRVFRTFAPEATTPFLTFQRISAVNQNDIDCVTERYQFDLVGMVEHDDLLEELKEALLDNLNRFRGDLGNTGVKVKNTWLDIIADGFSEDNTLRRITVDFKFAYLRPKA